MLKKAKFFLLFAFLCSFSSSAFAADTVEAFDIGLTDFEFYVGFDGIGLDKYEKTLSSETVLGFGFVDGFSGTFSASGESNEYFGNGSASIGLGLFGTPVDTDHFDLDLILNSEFSSDYFAFLPSMELNFDLKPDMSLWGIYLILEEVLEGRDESVEDDPTTKADESKANFAFAPSTSTTIGTYWTIADMHQLFLQYDMSFKHNKEDGEESVEIGGIALGYNVTLTDSIELINEVSFDIPQKGETFSVGLNIGVIASLPTLVN